MAAMCRTQSVFHPYSMFNHVGRADERQRGVDFILERISSGALRPRVDRVFAFDQVLDAYHYMESNEQSGKIVVELNYPSRAGIRVRGAVRRARTPGRAQPWTTPSRTADG